jgi:hypothetical protein
VTNWCLSGARDTLKKKCLHHIDSDVCIKSLETSISHWIKMPLSILYLELRTWRRFLAVSVLLAGTGEALRPSRRGRCRGSICST